MKAPIFLSASPPQSGTLETQQFELMWFLEGSSEHTLEGTR